MFKVQFFFLYEIFLFLDVNVNCKVYVAVSFPLGTAFTLSFAIYYIRENRF